MSQQFQLPDGRHLDYLVSGALSGFPLIFIHGTPGSYKPLPSLITACLKRNIKLVTFSRAGYGNSTRHKGRRTVSIVSDIEALKTHLGVEQCIIGGWSGGGPHALACAARLQGCLAVLCIAGTAPYDVEGLDWNEGQGQDNLDETEATLQGEEQLQRFCQAQRVEMLEADVPGLISAMSSLLPEVDRQSLLKSNEVGQFMVDGMQEALLHGSDGWVDDDLQTVQPWGFELDEVNAPVLLYQGSEDKMVPSGHGKWLAEHLPQGKLKKYLQEGQGHISIFVDQLEDMLDKLLAMAKQ